MPNCTFFGHLLAAFRLRTSEPDTAAAAADAGGFSPGTASPFGPQVNVDGTPMLNDAVDVMGKAYGDAGSLFSGTDSGGMFDSGAHGSDW